jgi:hypothetical protein
MAEGVKSSRSWTEINTFDACVHVMSALRPFFFGGWVVEKRRIWCFGPFLHSGGSDSGVGVGRNRVYI